MDKILLFGNGINIEFEPKFQLKDFITLLLNERELKQFFGNSTNFLRSKVTPFSIFNTFNSGDYHKNIENFCWIVKKCRKEIIASNENFSNNGVETVFKQLFEKVEEYLAFDENYSLSYDEFESTFKELFFTYIFKLQNENWWKITNKLNSQYLGFKNKLEDYMKIITLNYVDILEKITPKSSRDIIHWHEVIKERTDGTLDFSKCLLDTIRNPKSSQSFKQIPLFKNYQKYKNKFELDILGLNPMNDENVFALFINSQICKKINFYYHQEDDIKNLKIILRKIKNLWLGFNKNNKVILSKLDKKRFDLIKNN